MPVSLALMLERNEDTSPGSGSISLRDGRWTLPYYFTPTSAQGILDLFPLILGDTNPDLSAMSPGLQRSLPAAHPFIPYLLATNLGFHGVGITASNQQVNPDSDKYPLSLPQPLRVFTLYTQYEVIVEFSKVDYAPLADSSVTLYQNSGTVFQAASGNLPGNAGVWKSPIDGSDVQFVYKEEWLRFTTWEESTSVEWIEGVQGNTLFVTGSNTTPGGNNSVAGGGVCNNARFEGKPRMKLPDQLVRITWYAIPWRYVYSPNSYLKKYLGGINQRDWFNVASKKLYPAGSLLYVNYLPSKPYTPTTVSLDNWGDKDLNSRKLCDVAIDFIYTSRTQTDVPAGGQPSGAFTSGNVITSGHNLLPYFPRRAFYMTVFQDSTVANLLAARPMWPSFPFELLFQDPDYTNGVGGAMPQQPNLY